jgi:1,4-alpha-glucan branching enzyme
MEEKGYLLIVLHTHLPFIRHPELDSAGEESWLFEALVECYFPLLETFEKLVEDGVPFRISMSLTPPLLEMWADPLLQERFLRYLDDHARLAEREIDRLGGEPRARRLATMARDRFVRSRQLFLERWRRDLAGAFKRLAASGCVEILASSATHALLPLWQTHPEAVELQVQVGVRRHEQAFGEPPLGFWLPECAYSPGLDAVLRRAGLRYTFLEAHGLLHAEPQPRLGVHAPVHCPSGLAAFGRDWHCLRLVWHKDGGYPGEPAYLDQGRDIGYELPVADLRPFTRCDHPIPTGLRYRHLGSAHASDIYDPDLALQRCDSHAHHFVTTCQREIDHLHALLGRRPVLVAPFDTEHFGHAWQEGPAWLNLTLRKLVYDQKTVRLVTGAEYLEACPTHQVVRPHLSTWGYHGYCETWLMGRNHWVYPAVFKALEELRELERDISARGGLAPAAFEQALRELLLAQSSDWTYILHTQTALPYATRRLETHLGNLRLLVDQLRSGGFDRERIEAMQQQDNLFMGMDLARHYREALTESRTASSSPRAPCG